MFDDAFTDISTEETADSAFQLTAAFVLLLEDISS